MIKEDEKLKEYKKNLENAKIIQLGMLPKERHFKRLFKDYFTFYMPQDVISGDFYWVGKYNNFKYLAVGDCTGHGVSASLLSVLALSLFEYVIMNKGIKKTDKILREIDKKFIESFKEISPNSHNAPWIDVSLVRIEPNKKKIQFSSAHRKLLLTKENGDCKIYSGNNYPIGGWQIEENRKFESKCISYEENDIIYLGSDGFQDQFGGNKEKKYSSKRLHQFLVRNSNLPIKKQKLLLEKEFNDWKQEFTQTDDVCIVAVKL